MFAIRHFSCGSPQLHFTYTLSSSPSTLYVPITSHCNSRSLPATRGPSFVLPAVAVASLCRVRDIEQRIAQWEPWCQWLDTQPAEASIGLPPFKSVAANSDVTCNLQQEPSCETLMREINEYKPKTVVIAGEGEPFLRPRLVLDLVEALSSSSPDTAIRINTNGLVVPTTAYTVLKNTALSVALMTADSEQYTELMQPTAPLDGTTDSSHHHARVTECIQTAIEAGITVEATGVVRDNVDREATERLAQQLGCTAPVRWRPYFP